MAEPKDVSKKHFYYSLIKSAIRIGAGVALASGLLITAGTLLVIAEIFGVVEEL